MTGARERAQSAVRRHCRLVPTCHSLPPRTAGFGAGGHSRRARGMAWIGRRLPGCKRQLSHFLLSEPDIRLSAKIRRRRLQPRCMSRVPTDGLTGGSPKTVAFTKMKFVYRYGPNATAELNKCAWFRYCSYCHYQPQHPPRIPGHFR